MKCFILKLALLLFVLSCSEKEYKVSEKASKEIKKSFGYEVPPHPKSDGNEVLGVDANNNNVRDDFERWVYSLGHNKDKVEAYLLYGKWQREAFKTVLNKKADKRVSIMWYHAYHCMLHRITKKDSSYTDHHEVRIGKSFFENTRSQLEAKLKFQNTYFTGGAIVSEKDDSIHCKIARKDL